VVTGCDVGGGGDDGGVVLGLVTMSVESS